MSDHCCCGAPATDLETCGCCQGVEPLTPLSTRNRPGLPEISYRVGTHGAFLETMKARLSSNDYPALAGLTSRESDDLSIALLDAWATVADVLTFYQERIANEAYLRTATERRSVLELARLIGYRPRPGVAASVYLAYTIDPNYTEETVIPAGSRTQSVPGPGETAQSFETSEDLKARAQWNNLRPRVARPQTESGIRAARLYLKGVSTNLKPNDPLLIAFRPDLAPEFFRVREVFPDSLADRTRVVLQGGSTLRDSTLTAKKSAGLIESLTAPPSVTFANSRKLPRDLRDQFGSGADSGQARGGILASNQASYAAVTTFSPVLRRTLATAAAQVGLLNPIRVYALRKSANVFGHNMPLDEKKPGEGPSVADSDTESESGPRILALDGEHGEIQPEDWIAIERFDAAGATGQNPAVRQVAKVANLTLGGDQSGDLAFFTTRAPRTTGDDGRTFTGEPVRSKSSVLTLKKPWRDPDEEAAALIRSTSVYFRTEELPLAEEPILEPVCGGVDDPIELDGFYDGLESGRWVVVSGEREIEGTSGVRFSELSMLSSVTQAVRSTQLDQTEPLGEKIHTFIKLAQPLAYCFKRDSVRIYGNVVLATHGETRRETLGGGVGSRPLQEFELKQSPLTFTPAPNPSGVESTLQVYVNDIQWHETETLYGLAGDERRFVTKTNDEAKTSVIFGDGRQGARPPTGIENIRAVYRNGIGAEGNVMAEQISLLSTRPLGAKEVINPLPASGGANRESRDQARVNAPLAVMALDRLVSVRDYQDFTRVFAGVGKALATEISDGRRSIVHLTIAGAEDVPIQTHSDLYRNLTGALRRFGDPDQAFRVDLRELKLLVLSARVRIDRDYLWEKLEPKLRAALLDAFSFQRRELGQDALLSEVFSVMQKVAGVEYVDVDAFGAVTEKNENRKPRSPAEIADAVDAIVETGPLVRVGVNPAVGAKDGVRPAELAYLSPLVPASLILNEVSP